MTAAAAAAAAVRGPWDIRSDCTPACAVHTLPRVPAALTARRLAAFAHAVRRALTDGGRADEPVRLRTHARALLASLGIRREGTGCADAGGPAAPGQGQGQGLTVPAGGPGTLVVVNHISWLDIPALLAVEPVTLLAKREVGGWPVVGGLARRAGTHFIDRTDPRRLPYAVAELTELLASGRSVAVFPQATTWCTAGPGAFRRATFQAALDAGAPVRPVTVGYTQGGGPSTVAAFCGEDTFAASLRRVLTARALAVRVTAHPAVAGVGLDRRELAALAEHAVLGGRVRTGLPTGAPGVPAPRRTPQPMADRHG
ncbi:lysophospholipid acyltransferase family protein [Streptomyces sp. NPDC048650]|uniref:lysophospholipid acyltransferase family protein n=1 Tax=Streptomyces sp. NPDC048650 TaxID=3365583 RepID=UPI003718D539